jgi:hypothetical protein
MSYEVKFGYITGFSLVFTAYLPAGTARGEVYQPLPELAEGYYGASPATDLVAGDEIIAYVAEYVTYDGTQVYVLGNDYIYWENDIVNYEGVLISAGDETDLKVTYLGAVVGAQEYEKPADWYNILLADTLTISTSVGSIGSSSNIDESGIDNNGQPRLVNVGVIGYDEDFVKEL